MHIFARLHQFYRLSESDNSFFSINLLSIQTRTDKPHVASSPLYVCFMYWAIVRCVGRYPIFQFSNATIQPAISIHFLYILLFTYICFGCAYFRINELILNEMKHFSVEHRKLERNEFQTFSISKSKNKNVECSKVIRIASPFTLVRHNVCGRI